MKGKCLTVGIILLFVGTCILPTVAQDAEKPLNPRRGSWLYVGGSGPGNYTRIQDAIDNASDGDTVYVFPGVFKEHVSINKSILFQGSDHRTTIIDGQGLPDHIVTCVGTNAVIAGFTIHNCTLNHSCVLIKNTSGCLLLDCTIHTGGYGVTVRGAQDICILNNTFVKNLSMNAGYVAMNIERGEYVTLSKNGISGWEGGILPQGTHLFITNNTIINTRCGLTDTLNSLPRPNKYLTIDGNQFYQNQQAIYLVGSKDYSITNNDITDSTSVGIYLGDDVYSTFLPENISIIGNTITRSAQAIFSMHTFNMSIEGNHIQDNGLGISFVYDCFTSVTENTFQGNTKTIDYQWVFFPRFSIQQKVPQFDRNFWDASREFPHPVVGKWNFFEPYFIFVPILKIPWVTFDWHPSKEPYDIGGLR